MSNEEKQFLQLSASQVWRISALYPFPRKITEVHVHHTWRPRGSQYQGEQTVRGMWRYHTQDLGWSDIAQHVSIAPDGSIWTGRPWDRPPASARGFNGNPMAGPFMIEVIGDFDRGEETLEGDQRHALVETAAAILSANGLSHRRVRFHNEMTTLKSCPGTSVVKKDLVAEIRTAMAAKKERLEKASSGRSPFPARALFDEDLLRALRSPSDAPTASISGGRAGRGPGRFPVASLGPLALRRVREGWRCPRSLRAGTARRPCRQPESRPALGRRNLPQHGRAGEIHRRRASPGRGAASQGKRPARSPPLFAHGGLVSEAKALKQAVELTPWYRENNIFPIFFVWETGPLETLRQLVFGGQRGIAARGMIKDWFIEKVGRGPGRQIWAAMKHSAGESVQEPPPGGRPEDGGGALVLISALVDFIGSGGLDDVDLELYALGHSAGSILHAHFLPELLRRIPGRVVKDLFLLAPAVNVAEYKRRLVPLMGKSDGGIDHSTIFTMQRAYEEADRTVLGYRGSLLLLIYEVLEAQKKTPILGLQESLEDDPDLRRLFGIGPQSAIGTVVYSVTESTSGPSASLATEHGAFDNDPATMDSVVERILGHAPLRRAAEAGLTRARVSEAELDREAWESLWAETPFASAFAPEAWASAAPGLTGSPSSDDSVSSGSSGNQRLALTIGVDHYPSPGDRLSGCVSDAHTWAGALRKQGFTVLDTLENERATRGAILGAIGDLVDGARAGDHLAIHFSGHGTRVKDLGGDEDDAWDEALCPHDFRSGALLIDDDLAEIFGRLIHGASCTVFLDCCHSGTATRFAAPTLSRAAGSGARARYVRADAELERAHREFRGQVQTSRSARPSAPRRVVNFSACQPDELAYEEQGQGQFTLQAARVLAGARGMSNNEFQRAVEEAFAPLFRQRPYLDCLPEQRALPLLGLVDRDPR